MFFSKLLLLAITITTTTIVTALPLPSPEPQNETEAQCNDLVDQLRKALNNSSLAQAMAGVGFGGAAMDEAAAQLAEDKQVAAAIAASLDDMNCGQFKRAVKA